LSQLSGFTALPFMKEMLYGEEEQLEENEGENEADEDSEDDDSKKHVIYKLLVLFLT
jgi:hypothetical protein